MEQFILVLPPPSEKSGFTNLIAYVFFYLSVLWFLMRFVAAKQVKKGAEAAL